MECTTTSERHSERHSQWIQLCVHIANRITLSPSCSTFSADTQCFFCFFFHLFIPTTQLCCKHIDVKRFCYQHWQFYWNWITLLGNMLFPWKICDKVVLTSEWIIICTTHRERGSENDVNNMFFPGEVCVPVTMSKNGIRHMKMSFIIIIVINIMKTMIFFRTHHIFNTVVFLNTFLLLNVFGKLFHLTDFINHNFYSLLLHYKIIKKSNGWRVACDGSYPVFPFYIINRKKKHIFFALM